MIGTILYLILHIIIIALVALGFAAITARKVKGFIGPATKKEVVIGFLCIAFTFLSAYFGSASPLATFHPIFIFGSGAISAAAAIYATRYKVVEKLIGGNP